MNLKGKRKWSALLLGITGTLISTGIISPEYADTAQGYAAQLTPMLGAGLYMLFNVLKARTDKQSIQKPAKPTMADDPDPPLPPLPPELPADIIPVKPQEPGFNHTDWEQHLSEFASRNGVDLTNKVGLFYAVSQAGMTFVVQNLKSTATYAGILVRAGAHAFKDRTGMSYETFMIEWVNLKDSEECGYISPENAARERGFFDLFRDYREVMWHAKMVDEAMNRKVDFKKHFLSGYYVRVIMMQLDNIMDIQQPSYTDTNIERNTV